ncbi:unnamed protein product [Paramecium octaurelia]|uniref:Uncharacterized protein n=1 Tax=Paramecium octaurelia TaxID=43137 RepID=A0A8S1VJ68_PAROT|nr:unnamed protein product [Paramecium octaurelia]
MSQAIENTQECQLTLELLENVYQYLNKGNQLFQKLNPQQDMKEINKLFQKVENASICFNMICHYVDQLNFENDELLNSYQNLEQQLIQKEGETRRHISIESQLKLYAESLLESFEEFQKQLDNLNSQMIVHILMISPFQKKTFAQNNKQGQIKMRKYQPIIVKRDLSL